MNTNRRTFLKGAGVSIALPAFEVFSKTPATGTAAAKRFVCVAPNYGVYPGNFFPEQTGSDYELPELLQPLAEHRKDFTVFTNLDHPGVGGGHGCSNTFLNGLELKDAKNTKKLESLDQVMAGVLGRDTRFSSLQIGSGGTSWSKAGIRLPSELSPERLFNQLFIDDPDKIKNQNRVFFQEDASILDVVREDAKRLEKKLTLTDRDKLDEFLTSIRGVEQQLERKAKWIDVAKPEMKDSVIRGDGDDVIVDLTYPYNTPVMYDLMILALQSDSTRVITFGHPGGNRLFPFDGITAGYHQLTHHGKRPDYLTQLTSIEKYYTSQFSRFLSRMKESKDAQGESLFDTTAILFGSGMGNASSHSSRNLPILVSGGGMKHGQHHRFERHGRDGRPLSDLFVTLLQQMGIEKESFSTSQGNLNHLLT